MSHQAKRKRMTVRRTEPMMMPARRVRDCSDAASGAVSTGGMGDDVGESEDVEVGEVIMVIIVLSWLVELVGVRVLLDELLDCRVVVVVVDEASVRDVDSSSGEAEVEPVGEGADEVLLKTRVGDGAVMVSVMVTPARVVESNTVITRVLRTTGGVKSVVTTVVVTVEVVVTSKACCCC